jgi:hypothetical protein
MPNEYQDNQWWSETESPKAWMSVRDADLYEALIHRIGQLRADDTLRVIEWGAGRSTLWYSKYIERLGIPFSWLSLEHNKTFFEERHGQILKCRPNAIMISEHEYAPDKIRALLSRPGVTVVVLYDVGEVRPDRQGRIEDRAVDLDAYVSLPARVGLECDLAVIDGRKRRRCLLESARLLSPTGYAILHDAWRSYYHCAFNSFRSGRRFGDEWWIGSNIDTTFEDVLPRHAFERHAIVEESLDEESMS